MFKRKIVPFEIPDDARELTDEELFLVNGGAPAMTPEDQYNIAEAYKNGDQEKVDEIMSHYQNSGSGTTTTTPPTTSNTTPTTTTPPASVPTTPPANTTPSSSSSNNNGSGGSSGGGSGSSGGGSGGSSGSGSGSGSGGNSSPSSTSTTTTSQHKPSVSEQEGYLKAGLSHVEDYKKAARKTLGIRGSSVSGSSFKSKEVKGWRNNGDGTHTVTAEGATLWDRYGPNWRELSCYEGDPTKLHVGDTVGKKIKVDPGAGEMTITEMIEREKKKGLGEKKFSTNASLYSPDDPNPDKRYNGQYYYNEETNTTEHLMIVNTTDTYNYRNIRDYFLTVGKYGSADTVPYDGIAITNYKGEIIEIQKDVKTISEYSRKNGIPMGSIMDTISALGDLAGNASTATGFASILTESTKLGKASNVLGLGALGVDIIQAFNDPTFSNWYDVAADGAGLLPAIGPYAGGGMVLVKDLVEMPITAAELEIDYKIYDTYGSIFENNNAYGMGIGNIARPMVHNIDTNLRGLLGIGR